MPAMNTRPLHDVLADLADARLPARLTGQIPSEPDTVRMQALIDELVERGYYPPKTVTGQHILSMVRGYGVEWHKWRGPLDCKACKVDLRDHENGPPFKREIGIYDSDRDRTTYFRCPDCGARL